MFRNPFNNAFGLEIGDLSIKLIQLKPASFYKKSCFEISQLREIRLPAGLIVNGEIQQPEIVRQKLLQILGRTKNEKYKTIKEPWVVAGLPEVKTFLKIISIDAGINEITDADIIFQAKKHLPFELDEAYINWQLIESKSNEKYSQVLIGAIPKIIADAYTYLLESVQLMPIALEIEAVSLARSLITESKDYSGQARAILDLGATRSCLIIYDNNSIQFSTTLDYSGEIITTAIEQSLKINHQQAEEMKIKLGARYNSRTNAKYYKAISRINDKMIDDVLSALEFYKDHFNDQNPINHITMCGGVSEWDGLDNIISKKLKISSHPGNVWKNLNNDNLKTDKGLGLNLAVAIGLALRATQKPFTI
ncbi:MAG: hypothetical protein COU31_01305 [Candidatus Magasanikbacteria bacterium CG10_big_fil_rev_8_21_14_0_10_40_10]|uniref:SHS2 domain-containing protein n=1 Tax=Candidatus Magasanikbacteria bacterium CG10_big_fil_rev_8_21_14_0_10_40_10 TaxID=1974648 RepID=A0A2M6W4Q8_9BACT|nr:MAG: hypothetical protein COU31_01305 [Candidatus Magasanikbacteria bacterium CG10_big_fil_rev_8_21_14_0_10_40_10]